MNSYREIISINKTIGVPSETPGLRCAASPSHNQKYPHLWIPLISSIIITRWWLVITPVTADAQIHTRPHTYTFRSPSFVDSTRPVARGG